MAHEVKGSSYVSAWLALLLLTAASFGADHLALGAWATPVALAIAVLKAGVVLLVFMHLLQEPFSVRFLAGLNLLWVLLICLGIAADVLAR
jgi:cytochrome c oxidase subunit 4